MRLCARGLNCVDLDWFLTVDQSGADRRAVSVRRDPHDPVVARRFIGNSFAPRPKKSKRDQVALMGGCVRTESATQIADILNEGSLGYLAAVVRLKRDFDGDVHEHSG